MYNYKEKPEPETRACDHNGCQQEGNCRAPKNRAQVDGRMPSDYFWFCAAHAKEYNQKWDYFAGMSSDEIMAFQKDAVTGHRPTWGYQIPPHLAAAAIQDRMKHLLGEDFADAIKAYMPAIPPKHKQALDALGLKHPTSQKTIRSTYRRLVKEHHPDLNGGDKDAEERFKLIGVAYKLLKTEYGDYSEAGVSS